MPGTDEVAEQNTDRLILQPAFVARTLKEARDQELAVIVVHNHPLAQQATFSPLDDEGEKVLVPAIFRRAAGPHGTMVVGTNSFSARVYKSARKSTSIKELQDSNERLTFWGASKISDESARHDRSIRALGRAGQHVLQNLKIGIVGLGGTGSIVAQQLAYLGVRKYVLVDPQTLEESNLNRVVGAYHRDVGRYKVDIARRTIRAIAAGASVSVFRGDVVDRATAEPLLDCDFLFCCTDSQGSRAVLNQMAYQYYLPTIDLGIRIDVKDGSVKAAVGRVQLLSPGEPCLLCSGILDPELVRRDLLTAQQRKLDPYIVGYAEPQPAVISMNGAVSSMAVTMMLGTVTNFPVTARSQIYRIREGTVTSVTAQRRDRCVTCSLGGALGRGDRWTMLWRS